MEMSHNDAGENMHAAFRPQKQRDRIYYYKRSIYRTESSVSLVKLFFVFPKIYLAFVFVSLYFYIYYFFIFLSFLFIFLYTFFILYVYKCYSA